MKTMPVTKFKAQCLSLIDEVHDKHEEIIITRHGKPVARIVPFDEKPDSIFGALREFGKITGDLVSPVDDPESWECER
jgi:prevent-host-death family protein